MTVLDLEALRAVPLAREPYEHVIVDRFLRRDAVDSISRDFPRIAKPGLFPPSALRAGPAFHALIDELDGAAFEETVADKFDLPLVGWPKLCTVRGRCARGDGGIHTDSKTKIATVLLYLNPGWDESPGRLRVLRSGHDLEDYAAEIPPVAGTLFAFRRSDRSFHGHRPFVGERRAIQLNWIVDAATRDREQARHRWSSYWKSVIPFA